MAALARAISIVGTAQEADSCAVAFRRWAALPALQARTLCPSVCLILADACFCSKLDHDLTPSKVKSTWSLAHDLPKSAYITGRQQCREPRAQVQAEACCTAMAARRAAAALQDAFSAWAAYAAAMSPVTAIHDDDVLLAPRDSEVSSGFDGSHRRLGLRHVEHAAIGHHLLRRSSPVSGLGLGHTLICIPQLTISSWCLSARSATGMS